MIAAFSVEILLFSGYNKQVKRECRQVIVYKFQGIGQLLHNYNEKRIINGRV